MLTRSLVFCALMALVGARASGAVTTTISTSPGTPVTTGSVNSFSPSGADMGGMQVTVQFQDGDTQLATWTAGLSGSGSASGITDLGKEWSLSQSGDTFGNVGGGWNLTVQSSAGVPLVEVLLNGVPGDTMFDLKDPANLTPGIGSSEFTPGSERGWTLEVLNGDSGGPFGSFNLTLQASYEVAVQVGANPVLNDLYSTLRLTFGGDQNGLPDGSTLFFYQDTDLSGDPFIVPFNQPAPEPSSLLIVSGLGRDGGLWLLAEAKVAAGFIAGDIGRLTLRRAAKTRTHSSGACRTHAECHISTSLISRPRLPRHNAASLCRIYQ